MEKEEEQESLRAFFKEVEEELETSNKKMQGEAVEAWDPQFCVSAEVEVAWQEELWAEVPELHLLNKGMGCG